jgi:hypothetical protein
MDIQAFVLERWLELGHFLLEEDALVRIHVIRVHLDILLEHVLKMKRIIRMEEELHLQ